MRRANNLSHHFQDNQSTATRQAWVAHPRPPSRLLFSTKERTDRRTKATPTFNFTSYNNAPCHTKSLFLWNSPHQQAATNNVVDSIGTSTAIHTLPTPSMFQPNETSYSITMQLMQYHDSRIHPAGNRRAEPRLYKCLLNSNKGQLFQQRQRGQNLTQYAGRAPGTVAT